MSGLSHDPTREAAKLVAESEVTRLTRERDEARVHARFAESEHGKADAECEELRQQRDEARAAFGEHAAESQRRGYELQRERDRRVEHVQMNQSLNEQVQRLQSEVTRLTRALAAVEAHDARAMLELEAAEARVRELTEARAMHEKSEIAGMRGGRNAEQQWRDAPGRAAEAELAQANRRGTELLERVKRAETMLSANSSHWASEVLRALRGQET